MRHEIAFYRSRDERGSRMLTIVVDGSTIRIGGQDPGQFLKDAGLAMGFWSLMGD